MSSHLHPHLHRTHSHHSIDDDQEFAHPGDAEEMTPESAQLHDSPQYQQQQQQQQHYDEEEDHTPQHAHDDQHSEVEHEQDTRSSQQQQYLHQSALHHSFPQPHPLHSSSLHPHGTHRSQGSLTSSTHTRSHSVDHSELFSVPTTPPLQSHQNQRMAGGGDGTVVVASELEPPPSLISSGWLAMKRNLIPGLVLQSIALTIIIVYYSSNSAQSSFASLADLKDRAGLLFSFISTGLFGGLIPWCINFAKLEYERRKKEKMREMTKDLEMEPTTANEMANLGSPSSSASLQCHLPSGSSDGILLTGNDIPSSLPLPLPLDDAGHAITTDTATESPSVPDPNGGFGDPGQALPWQECAFYWLFWSLKGVEIDLFYQLQALVWGSGSGVWTIIAKVITDQFIYNPVWGAPSVMGGYMFLAVNFNHRIWWYRIKQRHFWVWVVPECLISCWIVWVPAVSMIYCLPSSLQLPLQNLVLCFWALILAMLAKK